MQCVCQNKVLCCDHQRHTLFTQCHTDIMSATGVVGLPAILQHYPLHDQQSTELALRCIRECETKTEKLKQQRHFGIHDMEPGFFLQEPDDVLLVDDGYLLVTPDMLHLLGRIIQNMYACLEVCCKWRTRGAWSDASNRIAAQWKIRPNERRTVASFPQACMEAQLVVVADMMHIFCHLNIILE